MRADHATATEIRSRISEQNDAAVRAAFAAAGYPPDKITPRQNVLTFAAWMDIGRVVRRGEKATKARLTIVTHESPTGEPTKFDQRTVCLFHEDQTAETGKPHEARAPRPEPTPNALEPAPHLNGDAAARERYADRWRQASNTADGRALELRNSGTSRQRPTRRRLNIYHGQLAEADRLHRGAEVARLIVDQVISKPGATLPAGSEHLLKLRGSGLIDELARLSHPEHGDGAFGRYVAQLRDAARAEPIIGIDPGFSEPAPISFDPLDPLAHHRTAPKPEPQPEPKPAPAQPPPTIDAATAAKLRAAEMRAMLAEIPGFFPTPAEIADRLISLAEIEPAHLVLDPSAGSGALLDAARRAGHNQLAAFEINRELCEILTLKGYQVNNRDFLSMSTDVAIRPDRVIMNPPFEDSVDAAHIQRAYELVKPGGRVVAIACEGLFFRKTGPCPAFRDWLEQRGATTIKLEPGAFADSGTGVATRIIIIDKPKGGAA